MTDSKSRRNWRKAFYEYYTAAPEKIFARFKLGAMLFFLGLVIIYCAYQALQPSLAQELLTLLGLVIISGGFLLAMLSHLRMLVGRIIRVFTRK